MESLNTKKLLRSFYVNAVMSEAFFAGYALSGLSGFFAEFFGILITLLLLHNCWHFYNLIVLSGDEEALASIHIKRPYFGLALLLFLALIIFKLALVFR